MKTMVPFAALVGLALMQGVTLARQPERAMRAPTARDLAFLKNFSSCVVARNFKGAEKAIDADFRDPSFGRQMDKFVQSEASCLIDGTLRIRGVVLGGFLAEALIGKNFKSDNPTSLVAYDVSKPPLTARDEGEVIALCTARREPVGTIALLATAPGSAEEASAIAALVPHVRDCTAQGINARFNKPGLRAILALAFRRLAVQNKGA